MPNYLTTDLQAPLLTQGREGDVDELAGQLATERFRAGAAADQVLDVLAAVAVDWE